ncbi:MAG: hypothetical protein Q9202_006203 [Teloschistes flavicans]
MDDISEKPPENIDPYSALGLDPTASAAEIKTAYKKLALKHHPGTFQKILRFTPILVLVFFVTRWLDSPSMLTILSDKAPASAKSTANSTFQSIAFAYAILSNPKRRTLYDTTGSTSETLAQDDSDDFDWLSFFRVQLSQNFAEDLDKFSASYKGSEEEKETLLATYTKYRGKMNKIYEEVMLSNPLDDEQRFQAIIAGAISAGQVESHDAFAKETQKSKDARMERARREAEEAEDEKKTNKAYQSIFGGDGKGGQRGMNDLAATIQGRQKEWQNGFMERMEERYGRGGKATDGKAKKRKQEEIEPDEAVFQRAQDQIFGGTAKKSRRPVNRTTKENGKSKGKGGRGKKAKTAVEEDVDDEDDEEIIDLQETSEGEEEAPEEEEVKPKPNPKPKKRAKAPKKAAAPATKARITRGRAKK